MSHRSSILAWDTVVEVNTPDDLATAARAACYTTLAVAAMRSQRKAITSIGGYVERTHTKACQEDAHKVIATATRWSTMVHGRAEWLPTVCDAMILRRELKPDGSYQSIEVDDRVTDAAQHMFGHAFGDDCVKGGFTVCAICRLADGGDWESALRRVALNDYGMTCAALLDGYKAARRGGLIVRIGPPTDPWSTPRPVAARRPARDEVIF